MRGMELWRPDWARINGDDGDPNSSELVQVTRETARLALAAITKQNGDDYYHNFGAAEKELRHLLSSSR